MATTNQERVGKALAALRTGLAPFASREFINHYGGQTAQQLHYVLGRPVPDQQRPFHRLDAAALLKVMWGRLERGSTATCWGTPSAAW